MVVNMKKPKVLNDMFTLLHHLTIRKTNDIYVFSNVVYVGIACPSQTKPQIMSNVREQVSPHPYCSVSCERGGCGSCDTETEWFKKPCYMNGTQIQ